MNQFLSPLFRIVFVAILVLTSQTATAGGGPESVFIVVNLNSDSSKLIANTYISLRGIPDRNVLYLDGVPNKEGISLEAFKEKILQPILTAIEKRKLSGSIDYIVYSSDFPTKIRIPKQRKIVLDRAKEAGVDLEKDNGVYAKLRNGEASITAMTYLAGRTIVAPEAVIDLNSNRYFRQPIDIMLANPFVGSLQLQFIRSIKAFEREPNDPEFELAIDALEEMATNNPGQLAVLYWLAKFKAKQGDEEAATRWITRAIGMGWSDRSGTKVDPAFASIEDPVFNGLVNRMSNEGRRESVSRGFRQLYSWAPNGMINSESGQGERYFLSTTLAVTRNEGNSESEAVRQLRRSVGADFTRPYGTFYFCKNRDDRTVNRIPRFNIAIDALQDLGYPSEVISSPMPKDRTNVMGLTSGVANYDWQPTGSSILPGAICENLTSHGARFGDGGGQTKLSEFLRYGAAGSSGAVVEPMNHPSKFPDPMIHVHYARGCSLAEAFYQSIRGPFHLIIVGDALCQPFAVQPRVTVSGLTAMETVTGKRELSFFRKASPVRVSGMELYVDGFMSLRDRKFEPLDFDTTRMSDGYHEIRCVFFAANQIETRSSVIIPIIVNNNDQSCELSSDRKIYDIGDKVSLTFSAEGADRVELYQHQRLLHESKGPNGTAFVDAKDLGRGQTTVRAVAIIDGKKVSSVPVEIQVKGPLRDDIPRTSVR